MATRRGCTSSYSGPFGLKLHRNVVYSTLSVVLFGRGPLEKDRLPPPPPHTHTRRGEGCLTFLTSFGTPDKRPLAGRFCGKMGVNYVSNLKKGFTSILAIIGSSGYFFRASRKKKVPLPPPLPPSSPHEQCLPAGGGSKWSRNQAGMFNNV